MSQIDIQDMYVFFKGNAFFKIAAGGMFLDNEWDLVFIVVRVGVVRIYASEADYRVNSDSHVYELILSDEYQLSEVIILVSCALFRINYNF